ncbi:MAG: chain length determinant protein EpsF, partial [Cytophagaceae bacterium]
MNFTQFLLILRARYKIILLTLLITVATTVVVSLLLPKTYKATTSLVLNYKGVDPVTGLTLPAQLMPGYMATQVDIINSPRIALKVVDDLKLADSPVVKEQFMADTEGKGTIRDWLANLLLKNLDVVPARESSVLNIAFKG